MRQDNVLWWEVLGRMEKIGRKWIVEEGIGQWEGEWHKREGELEVGSGEYKREGK